MAQPLFRAPVGTRDLLPPESARRRRLVAVFADLAERTGFGLLESPIFEDLGVFQRLGESNDVVTKELFEFFDKGDPPRHLALRPELTASVCRAFAEHRPTPPWKIWYSGPQFRYERPQAGRYRQFDQVGVETLGTDDPHADVEVIGLGLRFYEALGMKQVRLLINSLGDSESRPVYDAALADYLQSRRGELSEQSRATLERNPLRVLDSKREQDQPVIARAPAMADFLSGASAEHFATVATASTVSALPTRSRPDWCGASTTTPAPPSSSWPTPSTPPRTRWAAAGATTGWWRSWAGPQHRASVSPSEWTASFWPATPRESSPQLRHRWRCFWWTPPEARAQPCSATGSGRPAWAWTEPSTAGP